MTHFAKKHREEGIIDAAANHILNHLEFGGCLADYASLNIRYNKIRKLENIEPIVWTNEGPRDAGRIRFVNYYTISTGKIRKHKSKGSPYLKPEVASSVSGGSGTSTPRISIEDHSDVMRPQLLEYIMPDEITPLTTNSSDASNPPRSEPPKPSQQAVAPDDKPPRTQSAGELALGLPEIPPLPAEPETPNLDAYTDKDARKQTEKEARRARKAYEQAVKNREKAIKERARIIEKRRKKAEKEAATRASEERKRLRRETLLLRQIDEAAKQGGVGAPSGVPLPQATYKSTTTAASPTTEKESGQQLSRPTSPSPSSSQPDAVTAAKQGSSSQAHDASTTIGALAPPSTKDSSTLSPADAIRPRKDQDGGRKREKELKFCMLPRKVDSKSGGVGTIPGLDPREATVANNPAGDPTWVRVNMAGVDEVGAHCGLFFPGPHYEPLVGDVGERIVSWVQEDASKRAILAMGREAASDASGRD